MNYRYFKKFQMRSSGSSSRISSRTPSPSPSLSRHSSKNSPKMSRSSANMDDQISTERFFAFIRYLGKHVFIVVLSIIFGIFSGLSASSLLPFLSRVLLLAATLYTINFIFYNWNIFHSIYCHIRNIFYCILPHQLLYTKPFINGFLFIFILLSLNSFFYE